MAQTLAIKHGSTRAAWQGSGPFILGKRSCALRGPSVSGWGVAGCGVEPGLIEDYLLNYSSTASVKQPWIKKASARKTLGSSDVLN